MLKRLSDSVTLRVLYQDETLFGSAVTGRCSSTIRQLCPRILEHRQQHGLADTIRQSRRLLTEAMQHDLGQLYLHPRILREDWLYPDPNAVYPIALQIEQGIGEVIAQWSLPLELWTDLAAYLGEWQLGSAPPMDPLPRSLWNALDQVGALIDATEIPTVEMGQATLVGHSTVRLSDRTASLLVDPFVLPHSPLFPANYQPLSLAQMGRPDAVVITHSHPDHFDLGSLLRVGRDTPIYVPAVERESVLSIDMRLRLEQLGFRQIHTLGWFESCQVGSMQVLALPFYGEQPTVADQLHPEVRNQGNIYQVEVAGKRILLTADSGTDGRQDIKSLAAKSLEQTGSVDILLGGYRGFGLYPIQYLFSSVAPYLSFVPEASWSVRQQMMGDADDLIDIAEIWQAQQIIPYSDGGAPWYWLRGLGPTLDGSVPHLAAVDPPPESVLQVAANRSGSLSEGSLPSPVDVMILRPGQSLKWDDCGIKIHAGQPWPYEDPS